MAAFCIGGGAEVRVNRCLDIPTTNRLLPLRISWGIELHSQSGLHKNWVKLPHGGPCMFNYDLFGKLIWPTYNERFFRARNNVATNNYHIHGSLVTVSIFFSHNFTSVMRPDGCLVTLINKGDRSKWQKLGQNSKIVIDSSLFGNCGISKGFPII